ncbi:MAG: hypothetical protein R3F46_15530 [bacterium]
MKSSARYFVIMACISFCCSCGGNNASNILKIDQSTTDAKESISLELVESDECPTLVLDLDVAEEADRLIARLNSSRDMQTSQALLYLRYNPELLSIHSVNTDNQIFPDSTLEFVYTDKPGIVAIGQVNPGMNEVYVDANSYFAEVQFNFGTEKKTKASSAEDGGLKLRKNQEFKNSDVAAEVFPIENSTEIEIVWEEAIDGDYDHNGIVNISDLSPLGRYIGNSLVASSDDYFTETSPLIPNENPISGVYINRYDSSADSRIALRNCGQALKPSTLSDLFDSEDRYLVSGDSVDYSPLSEEIYQITTASITEIGKNFFASVVEGYEIYVATCPSGYTPNQETWVLGGGGQPGGAPRTEPDWFVRRPNYLTQTLDQDNLNMDEYNPLNENLTYSQFCTEKCTGDKVRYGSIPLKDEFRMYKRIIDPGILPSGDSFVMLKPLPGPDGDTTENPYGAYTYIPLPSSSSGVKPTGIEWANDDAGIQELQLAQSTEWSGGEKYQLRLAFNEATLTWDGTPDLDWEVRYAIFFAESQNDLWQLTNMSGQYQNMPLRMFYPKDGITNNLKMIDIERPSGYLELPNAPDFASPFGGPAKSLWFGVRAYAFKVTAASTGQVVTRLTTDAQQNLLDGNTVALSKPMPETDEIPPEDGTQPTNIFRSWNDWPLELAFVQTTTTFDRTEGEATITDNVYVPLMRPHQDNTNFSYNEMYESYFAINAVDVLAPSDYNENGIEFSGLSSYFTLRTEVYRTKYNKADLVSLIDSAGSFADYRNSADQNLQDYDLELFAVTLIQPKDVTISPNVDAEYTGDIYRNHFQFNDSQFGILRCNLIMSPLLPGAYFNSDGMTPGRTELRDRYAVLEYQDVDENGDPITTVYHLDFDFYEQVAPSPFDWNSAGHYTIGTKRYIPADFPEWRAFGTTGVIKYEHDFLDTNEFVVFSADPVREINPESNLPWNYFSILALNDANGNCSYAPEGEGNSSEIHWLESIKPGELEKSRLLTTSEHYEENIVNSLYWGRTDVNNQFWLDPVANSKESSAWSSFSSGDFEIRFPELAFNESDNVIGISYYRPESGEVILEECGIEMQSSEITVVDTASYGDTSVIYDINGDPHVTYLKLTTSGGQVIGQGSNRSGSSIPTGGVSYRTRMGTNWQSSEQVDNSAAMNASENQVYLYDVGSIQKPYCIVPVPGTSSGVTGTAGIARKTSGWSTTVLDVGNRVANQNIDSIEVVDGNDTVTFIAQVDTTNYCLILGHLTNMAGYTYSVLDTDNVMGYPSLIELPNGLIGISYMAGIDNHMRYGTWNGSSFSIEYDSPYPESGYQTAVTFDDVGDPIVLSLLKTSGMLLYSSVDSGNWFQLGWSLAGTSSRLIEANTIDVLRFSNRIYVVFINSDGTLGLLQLEF